MARKRITTTSWNYNSIRVKSDEEIKDLLCKSANAYSLICDKEVMFIYRKNSPEAEYKYYIANCKKENFIHLVGCKVNNYVSAEAFYDECLNHMEKPIEKEHITYKESKKTTSAKLEVFPSMFDYKGVKAYRMGAHNKITIKNTFEMAMGNNKGVLGFDKRKESMIPVPVTMLNGIIGDYATDYSNVIAVLVKDGSEKRFRQVVGCVTKGIAVSDLPPAIRDKIDFSDEERLTKPV